ETLKHYPFEFELQISYKLSANRLYVGYSVQNRGGGKMPFTLGAHPAFLLEGSLSEYALDFNGLDSLKIYKLSEGLLLHSSEILALSDGQLPLSESRFKDDALVIRELRDARITLRRSCRSMTHWWIPASSTSWYVTSRARRLPPMVTPAPVARSAS